MRRKLTFCLQLSLLLAVVLLTRTAVAQGYLGGDIGLGATSIPGNAVNPNSNGGLEIPMGLFYDRTIHKATAGLDLRLLGGGSNNFQGWGVGPRITYPIGHNALIIPYTELLLGSGGVDTAPNVVYPGQPIVYTYVGGIIVGTSVGIDLLSSPNSGWGMRLNYDYGQANGNVNTTYSSASIGVVFRVKTR